MRRLREISQRTISEMNRPTIEVEAIAPPLATAPRLLAIIEAI